MEPNETIDDAIDKLYIQPAIGTNYGEVGFSTTYNASKASPTENYVSVGFSHQYLATPRTEQPYTPERPAVRVNNTETCYSIWVGNTDRDQNGNVVRVRAGLLGKYSLVGIDIETVGETIPFGPGKNLDNHEREHAEGEHAEYAQRARDRFTEQDNYSNMWH